MEVRDSIVLIPTFSLSLKKLANDEEGRGSLACKGTCENGEGRKRVSMGLTERRKPAKNLVDSRKKLNNFNP